MKYSPTSHQIETAENLFIAMAFYQTVKPIFEQMETDLLATEQYHYSDEYYTEKWARFDYPADRILRDRKHLCSMAGLRELNTPAYIGTDSERFFNEMRRIAINAGFADAENTDCKAENEVIKCENELIKATQDIHKINLSDLWDMNHRKKLIDLTLKLLASFCKPTEEKKRQYFDARIINNSTITFQ